MPISRSRRCSASAWGSAVRITYRCQTGSLFGATAAALYAEALEGVGDVDLPPVAANSDPVWHLYVIRTADPQALALHLRDREIGTGFHYPEPAHLSKAYRSLGHPAGSFPVAEEAAGRVLSLPMFPGITESQIEAVVEGVRSYF